MHATSDLDALTSWATFDGAYRYDLGRRWDPTRPLALFIMLNPSTADATSDDPTKRRCASFARREGCGGFVAVNLFAHRSTDPRALLDVDDPIGERNVEFIEHWLRATTGPAIAAWGSWWTSLPLARRPARPDVAQLAHRAGRHLDCLGTTRSGEPCHPLYLRRDTPRRAWSPIEIDDARRTVRSPDAAPALPA